LVIFFEEYVFNIFNAYFIFFTLSLYLSLIVNMLNKVGFLSSRKIIEKEKEVFDAPY